MILFHTIKRKLYEGKAVRPMLYFTPKYSAYCPWVGIVTVGCYSRRLVSNHFFSL
jgi:hypothetical protein